MKKRLLGFLICTMLVSACVGCGSENANTEQSETSTTTTEETTTEQATEGAATPEATQEPHSHNYAEEITTDATCEGEGLKTFTCECGDTYTEAIPATGHVFENYILNNDATYTSDGTETAFVSNNYLSTEKVEVQQSTGGDGNSWAAQFGVTLPFTATLQVATEGITHHLLWNHPTSFDPDKNLICHFWDGTQVTISDFATYRSWPMAYVTLPDGTSGWALFKDGAGCYFTW